jgi:hypothetical protein
MAEDSGSLLVDAIADAPFLDDAGLLEDIA